MSNPLPKESGPVLKLYDDTVWPSPRRVGELEWTLRNGEPTKEDHLIAASVAAAYMQLIEVPTWRSMRILYEIQRWVLQRGRRNVPRQR